MYFLKGVRCTSDCAGVSKQWVVKEIQIFIFSNFLKNMWLKETQFNLLAPELFFLILAHSVYKM